MHKRANVKQHLVVLYARHNRRIGLLNHSALQAIDGQAPIDGADGNAKGWELDGRQRATARGRSAFDNLQLHRLLALRVTKLAQHAVMQALGLTLERSRRAGKHVEHRDLPMRCIGTRSHTDAG